MRFGLPSIGVGLAVVALTGAAQADRIALLPARGANASVDPAAVNAIDLELTRALAQLGHTLVPAAEVQAAVKQVVQDGTADTAEEYKAVGAATKVDWVVVGTVEPAVVSSRVELTAYLMTLSRVESVAREVDKQKSAQEEQEMLAVLLRPEGIGTGELPWEKRAPAKTPLPEPPPQPNVVVAPPAPTAPPKDIVHMDYMRTTEDVWPSYGNKRGFLAALQGFSLPAVRPSGASGNPFAMTLGARGGYALGDRGLEILADVGGNVVGPRAVYVDAGLRWMFTPSLHRAADGGFDAGSFFIGPEIDAGAFIELGPGTVTLANGTSVGSSATAHPLLGASLDVAFAATPWFALEGSLGDLRYIPAGDSTLLLFGATLGVQLRL